VGRRSTDGNFIWVYGGMVGEKQRKGREKWGAGGVGVRGFGGSWIIGGRSGGVEKQRREIERSAKHYFLPKDYPLKNPTAPPTTSGEEKNKKTHQKLATTSQEDRTNRKKRRQRTSYTRHSPRAAQGGKDKKGKSGDSGGARNYNLIYGGKKRGKDSRYSSQHEPVQLRRKKKGTHFRLHPKNEEKEKDAKKPQTQPSQKEKESQKEGKKRSKTNAPRPRD